MEEKQRTPSQNRSLHKYCTELADVLNEHGITIRQLFAEVEADNTMESVKQLWRTFARMKYGKESTKDLTTSEIQKVFEEVNRHISQWGLHMPFPSYENTDEYLKSYETIH